MKGVKHLRNDKRTWKKQRDTPEEEIIIDPIRSKKVSEPLETIARSIPLRSMKLKKFRTGWMPKLSKMVPFDPLLVGRFASKIYYRC
jgi:hypothetical protein